MRKSGGFTLLELMVAIALSALVALALYSTFMQTNMSVATINETTSYEMMVSALYRQLEKDIYGVAVPEQFLVQLIEEYEKKQKNGNQEKPAQLSPDEAKEEQEKKENQEKEKQDKEKKEKQIPPLKKIFYLSQQQALLKQLTFITRNALAYYTDKEQQDVTPFLVRIFYQLKEDKENPGTYRLLRSQGTELDPQGYEDEKKVRAYELARGIRKLEVILHQEKIDKKQKKAQEEEKEAAAKSAQDKEAQEKKEKEKEQKKPKEFEPVSAWSTDELVYGDPLVPSFIEMNITFDRGGDRQQEEHCMFVVAVADYETIVTSLSSRKPPRSSNGNNNSSNRNPHPKPGYGGSQNQWGNSVGGGGNPGQWGSNQGGGGGGHLGGSGGGNGGGLPGSPNGRGGRKPFQISTSDIQLNPRGIPHDISRSDLHRIVAEGFQNANDLKNNQRKLDQEKSSPTQPQPGEQKKAESSKEPEPRKETPGAAGAKKS